MFDFFGVSVASFAVYGKILRYSGVIEGSVEEMVLNIEYFFSTIVIKAIKAKKPRLTRQVIRAEK